MASNTGILGHSAGAAQGSSPQNLFQFIERFVTDGGYRQSAISDPNGTLKAAGVNIGSATVEMKYQEIKGNGGQAGAGQLLIVATNAGVDWTGDLTLVLNR
jgi:hypothetical protein